MNTNLRCSRPLALAALLLLTCLGVMGAPPALTPPSPPSPAAHAPAPPVLPSYGQPALDPTTGLPLPGPAAPPWKDPNWPEPGMVLTNVKYDGLPLSEVAIHLRAEFKEQFDVLLPVNLSQAGVDSNTGLPSEAIDFSAIAIRMCLKNVTASEVFQAMNLVFENDRTPVRWELKLVGKRPVALLRVLAEPKVPAAPRRPETRRMVYFVGDLVGDPKAGGMTLKQVVDTLSQVAQMAQGQPSELKYHDTAQLVVASGTPDQLRFLDETLAALRQKVELERKTQAKTGAQGPQTPETKPGETAAPK